MDTGKMTEVNVATLASILGLTARRVQQLAQDGIFTARERGKYLLADAVQGYVDFRTREKMCADIEREKLEAETLIKKAKAVTAELEAKELQGKMHRAEDVAAVTEDLVYEIRGMLLALPGRLAVDVAAAESAAGASEIIRREVHLAMEELSRYRYDPRKYEERVRERRDWDVNVMGGAGEADDE